MLLLCILHMRGILECFTLIISLCMPNGTWKKVSTAIPVAVLFSRPPLSSFNWNVVKICHIIMTVGTMKCDQRCMCSFKCGQLTSKLSSLTELIIALREFSTPGLICGFIMATRAVKPQWQSVLLHFRCCDTFSIVQVWVFAHWTIPRLPPFLPLSRVLLFGFFQCWVLFMALLPFLHHASFSSATSFFFDINLKLLQFLLLADSLAVMDFK